MYIKVPYKIIVKDNVQTVRDATPEEVKDAIVNIAGLEGVELSVEMTLNYPTVDFPDWPYVPKIEHLRLVEERLRHQGFEIS